MRLENIVPNLARSSYQNCCETMHAYKEVQLHVYRSPT